MNRPEDEIIRRICVALSAMRTVDGARACLVWRQQSAVVTTQAGRIMKVGFTGLADLGLILAGGTAAQAEVKTKTGRLSEEQVRWGNVVREFGAVFFVWRSPDQAIDEVAACLLERNGTRCQPVSRSRLVGSGGD